MSSTLYSNPSDVPGVLAGPRSRRGKQSKGRPRLIRLKEGTMAKHALRLGFINKGERVSDIPKSQMDDFALDLTKIVGPTKALRMFNAQIVLRTRSPNGFKNKMIHAKNAIMRQSKTVRIKCKKEA